VAPRGIKLEWTDRTRTWLAREAFDPVFGARPLKRNIQRLVQDPLALKLLAGDVREGANVTLEVAPGAESLAFETRESPAAATARSRN